MRSLLAAATLTLAAAVVSPALAQSMTPEESVTTTDPTKTDPVKTDPTKTDPKPASKADAKAAKGKAKPDPKADAKAAKSDGVTPVIPPSVGSNQVPPPGGRNVTATGKTMPPAAGRAGVAPVKSSTEVEMLKAQKAAEERNKAWDAKMRRTMSTICNGC